LGSNFLIQEYEVVVCYILECQNKRHLFDKHERDTAGVCNWYLVVVFTPWTCSVSQKVIKIFCYKHW